MWLRAPRWKFTRSRIANALGKIGPAAKAALPSLKAALSEAEAEKGQPPRVFYRLAIARIEGDPAPAWKIVKEFLLGLEG